ncbi:rhodanese-like domain-containing protein [Paracoccus sp. TK19116]|uniref:Rhodanese-like domain-containing protein n=1 Tax=Paracoccus albicereus TaxID=2922394 RepID=A0ABT1MRV6_9RHOB|nr:rhodanese-like domain-containing protein [Paracoccus albicereus]MCQ0970266.1 rhodanese-like domain-containing protein [Paracoccus albicereus]
MSELENWSPEQVRDAMEAGKIVLIDVRTPAEYAHEHINGALLMPMAFFKPEALPTQDGKRIVLHCGSGLRSAKMAQIAMQAGLSPLAHLKGGFAAWKEAGLPYIGTDFSTGAPKRVTG